MRNKPRIRFKGFTEDWEQREFSDIFSEVKSGLSRMLSNDDIGLPVVRANNINDGQLNLVDDIKYWYKNDPQGANTNNYLIEQGDILINFINSEAKMGTAAYVTRRPERDTIYTTNILRCKVNDEYNPYFIYSLTFLNSYKNYIASITKPAVNQASFTTVDFKKYSIKIPTVKEQNQIADLIETFNKLITLHQRKLEKLKLAKKALLQKLFPKNGSQFPEIRFKGFTDAWEQRKLDDVFQIIDGDRGKNYPGTGDFLSNGDVLFLDTGNVRKDGFNFDNKRYIDFSRDKLLRNGRLILGDYVLTSRGTLGNLAYYSQSIYNRYPQIRINSAMLILRVMNTIKVNNLYLYITLRSNVINEFMKHNFVGSAQPHITKKEFSSVLLPIPRQLEEQKIIGDFFDKLEKIITLHQRKLERLQEVKKGLLQKMFV